MADFEILPPLQPQNEGQGQRMVLLALLMVGVLFGAQYLMPKPLPAPPAAPVPAGQVPAAPASAPTLPPVPAAPEIPLATAGISGADLVAEFSNGGAGVTALSCLRNPANAVLYDSAVFTAVSGVPPLLAVAGPALSWEARWNLAASDAASARFETLLPGGIRLAKTLRAPARGYLLELELEAANPSSAPAVLDFEVLLPPPVAEGAGTRGFLSDAVVLLERPGAAWDLKTRTSAETIKKGAVRLEAGGWQAPKAGVAPEDAHVGWGGMTGSYFSVLAGLPGGARFRNLEVRPFALDAKGEGGSAVAALALGPWEIPAGGTSSRKVLCYAGPRHAETLAAADPALGHFLERGPIEAPLMAILHLLHGLTGNYGAAILLLTLLVRLLIHPLNRMAQTSMITTGEKMKRLQPRLDELKKRHKGNARKFMEEQSQLMKAEGMNPLATVGGCLPLLLQMPVFFALYGVLQGNVELRGAPFILWIRDLARSDTVLSGIPFLGNLNPLPLALMGVTFWQMWRAPKPPDPQMAQQQKMMMFMMPVMFGFMLYGAPSGLALYWFTSTSFSILEQWHIRRGLTARGLIPAKR